MSVKCLIYCSKAKPYLYKTNFVKIEDIKKGIWDKLVYEIDNYERLYLNGEKKETLNGKIVASFDCENVDIIYHLSIFDNPYQSLYIPTKELMEKSCLNLEQMSNYLDDKLGYAIHISNLEIFDEPKELAKHTLDNNSTFYSMRLDKKYQTWRGGALIKAPQNMCNVYDRFCNQYILISIRPEWVCKILNGEKTIEVRKQIVKALKELI